MFHVLFFCSLKASSWVFAEWKASECLYPNQVPAYFNMLYFGSNKSKKCCSLSNTLSGIVYSKISNLKLE
ncbi:hypothetical protein K3495_g7757 [Podosphaera aphanis]|nr:hypothetical protein K3495_g7757 [Podosphaera aphanis]